MSLNAGDLKHLIQFLDVTPGQDSNGDTVEDFEPFGEPCWAGYKPLSVKDLLASQSRNAVIVARFTVRYRTDLLERMRISFRGNTYQIQGLLPDDDNGLEYLTIPVSSIPA